MANPSNGRRRLLKLLRTAGYSIIVVFLCWQIWRVRHGLGDSLSSVGWSAIGLAAGFTVVGTFPGFLGWRLLVTGTGMRLTLSDAAWVFFLSGVTRYLPGAIWPPIVQAALAKRVGAPAAGLMTAGLITLVLTALSGGIVGLLAVPYLAATEPMWWLALPLVLSATGAVMLAPRLFKRLLSLGQRILGRGGHEIVLPTGRTSMGVLAYNVLGWSCNGTHAAILAVALGAPPASAMTLGIGGFVLSAVVGALSQAPAGLGVREVVLGLTFGVLVSGPDLITLLLLSRLLTTLGHVIATLGVLGLLAGTRFVAARRDQPGHHPSDHSRRSRP
ncbi:lysylphosphatidylglycerol synthase domain-containing protein [Nonomuraea sp. NPDC050404]|uniref:lysylphosphatidylglycerol synthase domain-containing protein n=1 Tax=Nonomuraea sp. NPDC050404 TaxID=3155783 RepID=UPI0033F6F7FB